jgi:hypothetical protein
MDCGRLFQLAFRGARSAPCLPRAKMHCSQHYGCSSGCPTRPSSAIVASVRSGFLKQQGIGQTLEPGFLREHNPIVRHTILRRRRTLEDAGLLERIGVKVHPDPEAPTDAYTGVEFSGLGLLKNLPFDLAYRAAEAFTRALQRRTKAGGFMKTLFLQRICSSFASGRITASRMLRREVLEDEEQLNEMQEALSVLTPEEVGYLSTIIKELSRSEARDPKVGAVRYFLTEHPLKARPGWSTAALSLASTTIPLIRWERSWQSRCPESPWVFMRGRAEAGFS